MCSFNGKNMKVIKNFDGESGHLETERCIIIFLREVVFTVWIGLNFFRISP
jgi:hypothetical protein